MSKTPPFGPRLMQASDLQYVTGGYGWLSNPLQETRDRIARDHPEAASPGMDPLSDQVTRFIQQQTEAQLREAMGDPPGALSMMDF